MNYRQPRIKKIKSLLLTALFLVMVFWAGAVAEKTGHITQNAKEVFPVLVEEVKTFFREKVILPADNYVAQIKFSAIITSLIAKECLAGFIRGP
ncbi:MAG: Uncharacterized protein XD97_0390 [Pelotomaculum thermopropionicum]|uniref:Uncharacterized protein n=1 Tax=Pelotomaculum thermopropionicum TaxID=110500 RepID=A0A117M3N9_9FIRM|nr:MAG: Uncharacterized protein XD97_0390 [Pelotomaculum thermopropionicum]